MLFYVGSFFMTTDLTNGVEKAKGRTESHALINKRWQIKKK